jgi:CBS domain containing-hemolysin-like protein
MTLLIFYVLLALILSFVCSLMEATLLSITPSYIAQLEQEGRSLGKQIRALKAQIDRPLAAILSLNTIAHTMGAAGAGAQAAVVFGSNAVGIFSAVMTVLILVLTEIIPKTLGVIYWRGLAPVMVRALIPMLWLMWPLVKMAEILSKMLASQHGKASFSREEFSAMAELGQQEGVIHENESRILKNLFRFTSIRVKDIMTPRIVVFSLADSMTIDEVMESHAEFRFSRILVYKETRDIVAGYVLKDDILLKAAQGRGDLTLEALTREIMVVPDALSISALLDRLLDRLDHIAMVVDEYGGFAGIVTMEDVVETLLGMEIVDEADTIQDLQEWARQQWTRRARRLGLVTEAGEVVDPSIPVPRSVETGNASVE